MDRSKIPGPPRERAPRMGLRLLFLGLLAVVIIFLLVQITEYEGGRHKHSSPQQETPAAGGAQQR